MEPTGIDFLRSLVANFNDCNEDFVARFTVSQLVMLRRAWLASGFDIYPDAWSHKQVQEALRGWVPQWDDKERPIYNAPGAALRLEVKP